MTAARTIRTYSCTSSAALLIQFSMILSTRRSRPPRGVRQAQFGVAQPFDVVAERRGLLEVEIGGGRLNLRLQLLQMRVELLLVVESFGAVDRGRGRQVVAFVDARHHLVDRADDRLRRDVVLYVVG